MTMSYFIFYFLTISFFHALFLPRPQVQQHSQPLTDSVCVDASANFFLERLAGTDGIAENSSAVSVLGEEGVLSISFLPGMRSVFGKSFFGFCTAAGALGLTDSLASLDSAAFSLEVFINSSLGGGFGC
jgi:hypothetical protein